MKIAQLIAAGLLGLVFVVFGLNFFLKFLPVPSPPEGTPAAQFMGVLFTTGFLAFVKVLEIAGGLLVAIPRTRPLGLLILTPIIVNILAFQVFVRSGAGLTDPPVMLVTALVAFSIWGERERVASLLQPVGQIRADG